MLSSKIFSYITAFFLLFYGCAGENSNSASVTGTYRAQLIFPEDIPRLTSQNQTSYNIDCKTARIDTFEFTFSINGAPHSSHHFACDEHKASIRNIPVSVNRVDVYVSNTNGDQLLHGYQEAFIEAGKETNGRITLAYSTNREGEDSEEDENPQDNDGDGFTPPEDCDDTNALIHPGAEETADNGIDEDCDGTDSIMPPSYYSFQIADLGMEFVRIPAGNFMMGSPIDEPGRGPDETQHLVTISQAYYIQTTEVTQAQWEAVVNAFPGTNLNNRPSSSSNCGQNCPVESISWEQVIVFIDLIESMQHHAYDCRLPSEAEWEYAARAGSQTAFANGEITYYENMAVCSSDQNLEAMAWYCHNANISHSQVALQRPNDWGLYDMHGNVSEWCSDWYDSYSTSGLVIDPEGPEGGLLRVVRGGGYNNPAYFCRSALRSSVPPDQRYGNLGFRLVCSQVSQ